MEINVMCIIKAVVVALLIAAAYAGLAFFARSVPFDEKLLRDAALVFVSAVIIELMVAVWSLSKADRRIGGV